MTRYKQELRKRGYKLDCDFPFLPYNVNSVSIEQVTVQIIRNKIVRQEVTNVGTLTSYFDRCFNIVFEAFD